MKIIICQKSDTCSETKIRHHELSCDRTKDKGGTDLGPMGGEYLLMGIGGCFMSNLLAAVKARNAAVSNIQVEVEAVLDSNPSRFSKITLSVEADHRDEKEMKKLITIAERGCIAANTVKGSVELSASLK